MTSKWAQIEHKHVIEAIRIFEKENPDFPQPRNTFLIYNGKHYPAKHIRAMAYKIAFGSEISKEDFSGGQETANFFQKLGFEVDYKKNTIEKNVMPTKHKVVDLNTTLTERKVKTTTANKKLSAVTQKNALHILLQKHFGFIEVEKKYDWLKTPDFKNLPKEYISIVKALESYRNRTGFKKSNYKLSCDIVLEEFKILFEYDENQHFSKQRGISLENYPKDIILNFDKTHWINSCNKINAKDNDPKSLDRDEIRAFYDSVRDIEASKNGYKLIRIKHGDFDWESDQSETNLKLLLNNVTKSRTRTESKMAKIARLVVTEEQCDNKGWVKNTETLKLLENFIGSRSDNQKFDFIITPAGFLHFIFPKKLQYNLDIEYAENNFINLFHKEAEKEIFEYFNKLEKKSFTRLKQIGDYFTIGIDGNNPANKQHIELVAVFDLKKEKIIQWTGKFYPNRDQEQTLIKINDPLTHLIELNGYRILILGCHDLNSYSPRGQANATQGGWRHQTSEKFRNIFKKFQPDIFLQHPHTTISKRTWSQSWGALKQELPTVTQYASGITYFDPNKVGNSLKDVLGATSRGDVFDFIG
jgi:hypothetical protein